MPNQLDQKYFDSLLSALSEQRNEALNRSAILTAENAKLQAKIEHLEAFISELGPKPSPDA